MSGEICYLLMTYIDTMSVLRNGTVVIRYGSNVKAEITTFTKLIYAFTGITSTMTIYTTLNHRDS